MTRSRILMVPFALLALFAVLFATSRNSKAPSPSGDSRSRQTVPSLPRPEGRGIDEPVVALSVPKNYIEPDEWEDRETPEEIVSRIVRGFEIYQIEEPENLQEQKILKEWGSVYAMAPGGYSAVKVEKVEGGAMVPAVDIPQEAAEIVESATFDFLLWVELRAEGMAIRRSAEVLGDPTVMLLNDTWFDAKEELRERFGLYLGRATFQPEGN